MPPLPAPAVPSPADSSNSSSNSSDTGVAVDGTKQNSVSPSAESAVTASLPGGLIGGAAGAPILLLGLLLGAWLRKRLRRRALERHVIEMKKKTDSLTWRSLCTFSASPLELTSASAAPSDPAVSRAATAAQRWRAARLRLRGVTGFISVGKIARHSTGPDQHRLAELLEAHPWLGSAPDSYRSAAATIEGSAAVRRLVEHAIALKQAAEPAADPLPAAVFTAAYAEFERQKMTTAAGEREALQLVLDTLPEGTGAMIGRSQQQLLRVLADGLVTAAFERQDRLVLATNDDERLHLVKEALTEHLDSTKRIEAAAAESERYLRMALEEKFARVEGGGRQRLSTDGSSIREVDLVHKQLVELVDVTARQHQLALQASGWNEGPRVADRSNAACHEVLTLALDVGFESSRGIHTPQAAESLTVRKSSAMETGSCRPSCPTIAERTNGYLLPGHEPACGRCVPSLAPLERPSASTLPGFTSPLYRGFTFREKVNPLPVVGATLASGTRRASRVHPAFEDIASLPDASPAPRSAYSRLRARFRSAAKLPRPGEDVESGDAGPNDHHATASQRGIEPTALESVHVRP